MRLEDLDVIIYEVEKLWNDSGKKSL
jgi:hypothetical protein